MSDTKESICQEADRLVSTDRQEQYGHPALNFCDIAQIWSVLLRDKLRPDAQISAKEAALCMVGLKLAREAHQHKRDNLVDLCGYAKVVDLIHEHESRKKT